MMEQPNQAPLVIAAKILKLQMHESIVFPMVKTGGHKIRYTRILGGFLVSAPGHSQFLPEPEVK